VPTEVGRRATAAVSPAAAGTATEAAGGAATT
jgi:hypothetical protein